MEFNLEQLEEKLSESQNTLDLHKPIDFSESGMGDRAFNPHEEQNFWDDSDYHDSDSEDEDSIDADIWDSDVSYEEMSEEQQWNNDNPDYPYEDANKDDEINDTHNIEDWREYRDAKLNSNNPDDFMSYGDWQDEKAKWEEDHPDGPSYSDAFQNYQNTDQEGDTELAKWREYREMKDNSDDTDSFPSYEDWTKNKETSNSEPKVSYDIHTRNESLEGDRHPITGVPFEKKTVKDAEGNDVTGVFPVFDSEFDAQLPEDLYQASDKEQFAECNKQLKESVDKDPDLASKFTPEQLEQIENGDTPDGYTWHHNEETGKMQLVDADVHAKTGHTGGKTIWGGGNDNR